jgi:hypothetical protein
LTQLGCVSFDSILLRKVTSTSIAALVIGIVIALTRPYMLTRNAKFMKEKYKKITELSLFKKLFGDEKTTTDSGADDKDKEQDYNDFRINFDSEYAVANPVTSHEGIEDIYKFREVYNSKLSSLRNQNEDRLQQSRGSLDHLQRPPRIQEPG